MRERMRGEQKPLYVYRIDRETGIIEDYIVTDYQKYRDEVGYTLPDSTNRFFTKFRDFDIAKSGKVVSWKIDKLVASTMLMTDLCDKRTKAYDDYKRYDALISKIERNVL